MAEAGVGRLREVGHAPRLGRVVQQDSQDCGCLGGKDGAERARLGLGLVGRLAFDVHGVEGEAGVAE